MEDYHVVKGELSFMLFKKSKIVKAKSLSDYIIWGSAFFPNIVMSIIKNGRLKKTMSTQKKFGKDILDMIHI